ncbi:MAG TPA: amidohydrolase family protein [Acidimicrobiia bacterium]|nr:amidohydrolase family protein [Acidimicrobiia bacterium]
MTATVASVTPAETDLPGIISVDDHILEPRDLWQRELPARWRDQGPQVSRERIALSFTGGQLDLQRDVADGQWCDVWLFDDLVAPTGLLHAAGSLPREQHANLPAIYEDFEPSAYDRSARLAAMDANHVDVALNYPNTFPRFAGQGFAERADKELALACLQIYNDWMIDEWCGGAARGRLVPLTLVPLWDPKLAAAEVRRCATKGSFAIAFSENPSKLGYPSLYTGEWDPLWVACEETDTTVSMHIGSSSSMPTTSPDAPLAVSMSLNSQNAQGSLADWIWSRTLERFPRIKLAYAESQVGWMPFQFERMDGVWHEDVGGVELANPPSSYARGRVFGCIFDDLHGLRSREAVGMDTIVFETDFPHPNGSFPDSRAIAHQLCTSAQMNERECYQLLRGNAIACYGLARFGIDR